MKATFLTDQLLAACQGVKPATADKNVGMPTYRQAKMVIADDDVTLLGTDLEIGLRHTMTGAAVHEPGQTVVPLAPLTSILQECPGGEVELEVAGNTLHVRTATAKYKLPTENADAFADLAQFDADAGYYEVAAGDLHRIVRRTVFAVPKEDGKYTMRGMLWSVEADRLTLVGTDSKRLSMVSTGCVIQGEPGSPSALIPGKAVRLLEQVLSRTPTEEPVRVRLGTNDALISAGPVLLYTRLVEGRFPPYGAAFESARKKASTTQAMPADLLSATRQAAALRDETTRRIDYRFKKGLVELSVESPSGSSRVSAALPEDGWKGEPAGVAFEADWLTTFLPLTDPDRPITLRIRDGYGVVFECGPDWSFLLASMVELTRR